MSLIILHNPVASARALRREHMFPGRSLGEEEFDRAQAYADARLAPLLLTAYPGIVHGLQLNLGPSGAVEPSFSVNAGIIAHEPSFSVNTGIAVAGNGLALGLHYPLRGQWQTLVEDYLKATGEANATGVYYLVLRRAARTVDAPSVEPCQRAEFDPTRDSQLVVEGSLALQRLAIDPAKVISEPRERIENWVAADRVDASFMSTLGNVVPLALVAIEPVPAAAVQPHYKVKWLSQEAGRYEALPNSGYRVLLNQVSATLRRVMQRAAREVDSSHPLGAFLDASLHLDYLPAAGQLPLDWLRNPDSVTPNLLWLPNHLGLDMVPVPEEAVLELIQRHLPRRAIDLRQPSGDQIRLLLAVNEPDYRPDLLDIPPTDAQLEADIYRFFMRAYEAWRRWRMQFDVLYYVEPSNLPALTDPILAPIEHRVLNPSQFKDLGLPKPLSAPTVPDAVQGPFQTLIARAKAEISDPVPYPYIKGVPARPAFYSSWLVGNNPPTVSPPSDDGLVVQYAVGLVELEAIENQLRTLRSRVEKTRDFLLLQRQQLDSQTVAMAALGGGVAGDGGGLQVARWLPYTNIDFSLTPQQATPDFDGTQAAAATTPKAAAPEQAAASIGAAARGFTAKTAATGILMAAAPAQAVASVGVAARGFTASNVSSKLLDTALVSNASQGLSMLGKVPQSFSAFELSINQSRMAQLAQVAKVSVSKPAFAAKEYRFGVMEHISPEINEYAKAYYGMKDLLNTITDLFDPTDAASLRASFKKVGYVDSTAPEQATANPFEKSSMLEAPAVFDALATKNATKDGNLDTALRNLLLTQYRYHGLFKAGKILTQWIAITEGRYNDLERKLQGKQREQAAQLAKLDKLAGLIRVARETLENLDRFRVEQLGDYGVAARLLDEDWHQVYATNKERTRILTTALRGLYYVRVHTTPVSTALADPLVMRYGTSRDIVPGCDWTEDVALPAELNNFFHAVCEIPMDDWAALKPLLPKLPAFEQYDFLNQLRQSRFKARPVQSLTPTNTSTLHARLLVVQRQTQVVMQQWARATLPQFTVSSLQTQAAAARVLSLEDLSNGAAGALRKQAQELREKLEHCQYCLLQNLNKLPPSLRLQWGQLAEDDQLRADDVSWWPGLDGAERDDFNATRTVSELISWWFRQLDTNASANGRSAMRNMIRAMVIFASLGDPQEIVRGNVHVPPRLTAVGERLQVQLNRAPAPGTRLLLMDIEQRPVAVLAVEDHSPQATQVQIVSLMRSDARINTRFTVVANQRTNLL